MNELIVVKRQVIGNETVNAVDARELHRFLESGQQFADWIKNRIEKYDFIEGVDYIQFHNFVKSDSRARIEYALSLDMAKQLAMVENNDKGKQARLYFIECEKKLRAIQANLSPAEYLLQQAQLMVEVERRSKEALEVANQQKDRLDQIETAINYFTVIGYFVVYHKGSMPLKKAQSLGIKAAAYCKIHKVEIGDTIDQRFGRINTYPKWVLDIIFEREATNIE